MASSGGGGDKGIVTGMVTYPKPLVDAMLSHQETSTTAKEIILAPNKQALESASQSKDKMIQANPKTLPATGASDTYSTGPGAYTEGDVEEEEDEAVEVLLEDDEVQLAGQWTVLSRFYSLRSPNQAALFDDMKRAWRLRANMKVKSLRDNMFIITFSSEGDYNFVLQGGPWLHRGDALLVAKFDGLTSPSMVPLEFVPIWVRIYDLPLVLMTKRRGELYGSKLGHVREVDVGEDGRNKHDFFRILVDLSVKKPLKTSLAIKINVQGSEAVRRFELRYERVPFFYFICGYIGHSDKDCDKRIANIDQPFRYSAELRCSPLKPFERRMSTIHGQQKSGVARNLAFRGAGSASSSSSKQGKGKSREEIIPDRVDAWDGFEGREDVGDGVVDELLASQTSNLNMSGENMVQKGEPVGMEEEQRHQLSTSNLVSDTDMIPAIQNLQQPASFGGESSEDISDTNQKRVQPQSGSKISDRVQQALVLYGQGSGREQAKQVDPKEPARALKRFRKTEVESMEVLEATSPGATGKLTGPALRARQEQ